ncbi:unnamed protein product [Closterium sp. NIES-64]|nr:unnamed protein product [Closterium sp. NIES-64]
MGSDPWRTDTHHGAGGECGHRHDTGAYRSPDEGYRRREDRSRGRGLEELFSGRQGDLDVDGEGEVDMAEKPQEMDLESEAKGDDEAHEEGAGEQRDMHAEVKEASPMLASEEAAPGAAEIGGKDGARNQTRGEEGNDDRRRSRGSRSPTPHQHHDQNHGGERHASDPRLQQDKRRDSGHRSPDPRLQRDERRGGDHRSPDPRRQRDERRGGDHRSPDPRLQRDERRGGDHRSPDPRLRRDERRGGGYCSPDPRRQREDRRDGGNRSPDSRQQREDRRDGGYRSTDVRAVARRNARKCARLTRNGILEEGGEARRARRIGGSSLRRVTGADIARHRGSGAGI